MRIALISDIHGNAVALEAVLADIDHHSVDRIICLGDVATIGPQPRETLDILENLEADFILGNHDAALLEMSLVDDLHISSNLHTSMDWCEGQLTGKDKAFLRSFKPEIEVVFSENRSMLCFHGSPKSNTDVLLATTPAETINSIFNGRPHKLMAGGHTHVQMLRQHFGTLFINPGSVGNAFCAFPEAGSEPLLLPWAEYGLIDYNSSGLSVDLRRVDYDLDLMKQILRSCTLPVRDWLLEQLELAETDFCRDMN